MMRRKLFGKEFELVDLSNEGNNDIVFNNLVSTIEYLYLVIEHNELILGGSILVYDSKRRQYNYNCGWTYNGTDNQESLRKALDYLKRVLELNPNVTWKVEVSVTGEGIEYIKFK